MAGDDNVPTTGKTQVVPLKCGGVAYVRRVKRSVVNDIARAASLDVNVHSAMLFTELQCRWAITGADRLADADTKEAVVFSLEKHGLLGPIASRAVYDALGTEDVVAVRDACGVRLEPDGSIKIAPTGTEKQEGN